MNRRLASNGSDDRTNYNLTEHGQDERVDDRMFPSETSASKNVPDVQFRATGPQLKRGGQVSFC